MLASYIHMYICMYVYGVYMCRSSLTVHQFHWSHLGRLLGDCSGVTSPLHCDVHQGHPHGTDNKYLQEIIHNPHPNSDSIL